MSGIAVGGLVIAAGTTAYSFYEADQQRKAAFKADEASKEAIDAAKKKISVNYIDDLEINKEAYEIEADRLLSQAAMSIDAGATSERGAGAVAGRVAAVNQKGQRQVAAALAQRLDRLDLLSRREDSKIATSLAGIDKLEATGAQVAAGQATNLANRNIEAGLAGVGDVADRGIDSFDLYAGTDERKAAKAKAEAQAKADIAANGSQPETYSSIYGGVGSGMEGVSGGWEDYGDMGYDEFGNPL